MRKIVLSMFLGALIVGPVCAQELTGDKAEAAKKEILSLEHEKVAGLRGENSGHADWVEHYDSDSIVQVNADGSTRTKAQHLSELRAKDSKVLTMNQYQYEMHVYNEGSTVVVTNRATGTLQQHEEIIPVESRFTDVWVKQNGQWRRVVHDITNVKA
jgi:hypothetical protein